jgi:MoaA/NifB/PqqE/SkfB family radical SAM enzyme
MVQKMPTFMRYFFWSLKEIHLAGKMGIYNSSFSKIMRIAKYLFLRKALGKGVFACAIIGLTNRCQCQCSHCSTAKNNTNNDTELSTAELYKLIDDIAAIGVVKVNLFGGEPLLREDILDIVAHASRKDLFVFIDTNGIRLDRKMAKTLKKAGTSCVLVSLYSHVPEKNDYICGRPGTYENVINAFKACAQEGLPCVLSTIATHDLIDCKGMEKLISIAYKYSLAGVRILLPILSGKWQHKKEELLEEEEIAYISSNLDPGFVYIESGFSFKKSRLGKLRCCAFEKEIIYVSPAGNVQPCYAIPHIFGNIKNRPFSRIASDIFKSKIYKGVHDGVCIACKISEKGILSHEQKGARFNDAETIY